MIREIEVPQSGWVVTKLGGPVIAIAKAVNALRKLKFVSSNRWHFTWDEGGAIIEYIPTAAAEGDAQQNLPWTPYLSPTATGDAAGRTIRINVGPVSDGAQTWLPARRNIEIVVPANCTDGFFVWLVATVSATGVITSLDYDCGTTLPGGVALSSTSAPPPTSYDLLFYVVSDADSVTLRINNGANQFRSTPLTLLPVITNQSATATERRMVWGPQDSIDQSS